MSPLECIGSLKYQSSDNDIVLPPVHPSSSTYVQTRSQRCIQALNPLAPVVSCSTTQLYSVYLSSEAWGNCFVGSSVIATWMKEKKISVR
ncbi:hypothetical protein RJ55_04582 [Drechmeria coniospora]|nr:hypothetical protein RJ55_04582 [Drechmeria coniospora]